MRLRLVTYNIHKGIGGVDRRYRPERVIEALEHVRPDVVFLQEVDDGVPRSRLHRQVDMLGEALEMSHRAFQANVKLTQGVYGNAILSRYPLSDVHDLDLSIRWKKRRRALVAHCQLHDERHERGVWLVNCHLGLAEFERRIQVRRILDSDVVRRAHASTAVITAGDMNDVWGRLGRFLLEPAGFQSAGGACRTFPAVLPVRALDRIYYRGGLELERGYVSRTAVARQASDHLPLVAEFALNAVDPPRMMNHRNETGRGK